MAWGIAAIAIVIGGLGMMNTMVMSVFERTREVGVLRAVGWGKRRVLSMIMGEALVLSFLGGLLGILLGVGMIEAAARAPACGTDFLPRRFGRDLVYSYTLNGCLLYTSRCV